MRGRSYASDNWRSFEKGAHSFVEEGFVHDKTLTFKARLENENDGVTIKETVVEKTQGLSGAGEINVWLAADAQQTFSAKVGTTSNLNLQFDNGVRSLKRISQNFYAGIEVNRSFTENFGRVGVELFKEGSWSLDNRLVYNISRANLTWDGKGYYLWKDWRVNGLGSLELANKPTLSQLGLLLRWSPSADSTWFMKLERKGSPQTPTRGLSEGLAVGWNGKASESQTVGVEARLNLNALSWKTMGRSLDSLWVASEWRFSESRVKFKINTDLSHALTVTNKLGTYGEYSLGVEVTEVGGKNRFKFGTQIDLSL